MFKAVFALSSKVCDLFTASGLWDVAKIQMHFNFEECWAIHRILLGGPRLHDRQVWHFEKSGLFSVKSCYRLAFCESHQFQASSSDPSPMVAWWKFMWNLPIPSKYKIFLWRFCHDQLLTRRNLLLRGVVCPRLCALCGRFEEDSYLNLFWRCKIVRRLWLASQFSSLWQVNVPLASLDILCDFQARLDGVAFAEFVVFLRAVWNLRNQAVWSPSPVDCHLDLGRYASDYVRRFLEASVGKRHNLGLVSSSSFSLLWIRNVKWVPPSGSLFKLNVDAAFHAESGKAACGVVVFFAMLLGKCCLRLLFHYRTLGWLT